MIYGEKFLSCNVDKCYNLLENDYSFINDIILESENAKFKFADIVKKVVNGVCKFITILIDKISIIFQHIIPKFYDAAQKLIVKIKKSDVNYQGIKDIEIITIKPEHEKAINSFQDIFSLDDGLLSRYEIAHKKFNDDIESYLSSKVNRYDTKASAQQLRNIILKYNNAVYEIKSDLKKNTDKYFKYYAYDDININDFFKKDTIWIESVNDYEKLMNSLKEQINGNKSSTPALTDTVKELTNLSKRLNRTADEIYKSDKAMEDKAREIRGGTKDDYFTYAKKNGADFTKDPYDPANKEAINKSSNWGYSYFKREEFDSIVGVEKISESPVAYIAKQVPKIGNTILKIHVKKIQYLIKAYNNIAKACINESFEINDVEKNINEVLSK